MEPARLAESLLPLMHDERKDAIGMAEDSLNASSRFTKASGSP